MEMQRTYRIWIQRDLNLPINRPSTQTFLITVTPDQYRGVYYALEQLTCNLRTTMELDEGQPYPTDILNMPNMPDNAARFYQGLPFGTRLENIGNLYQTAGNTLDILPIPERTQNRYWVLIQNPLPEPQDNRALPCRDFFILTFKTPQELQGIISVYQWLGFQPKDYLIRIEDNAGNLYTID